jgi:phosphonate transport system permease protein
VLAIAIHTIGAMGKLFAEVNENASLKPVEGIVSTGGGWHAGMIFGVLPQVLPNFISYALLRFEINIRGAAVMGFVGAGGIGQELVTAIRQFYYTDISAILVMLIVTVMIVDILTEKLRHMIIRDGGH